MKVVIVEAKHETVTPLSEIPAGTVFTGKVGNYDDELFYCSGDSDSLQKQIVSLSTSNRTWTTCRESVVSVANYRPVKKLTAEV